MANQEPQNLDNIIASRRAMLLGGGAALAALALPSTSKAALTVTTFTFLPDWLIAVMACTTIGGAKLSDMQSTPIVVCPPRFGAAGYQAKRP